MNGRSSTGLDARLDRLQTRRLGIGQHHNSGHRRGMKAAGGAPGRSRFLMHTVSMEEHRDPNARDHDLGAQRNRLEHVFVTGWVKPARGPVSFSEEQLARIEHVRDHGGWLYPRESEYLRRVQDGARRDDPLPAAPGTRRPFVNGFAEDFEIRIVSSGEQANVVILFCHAHWPGVRFGHRFPTPDQSDGYEQIWLMEAVETGRLNRLMSQQPTPDHDGVTWTDW
jgi:hypothetical protein